MKKLTLFLLLCACLLSCNTSRNTATTRWWQSFVTRYNVYYNASVAYREGQQAQRSGLKDDYTALLPMFGVGYPQQQNLGKGNFETAVTKCEKAIQLHSIKKRPVVAPGRTMSPQLKSYLSRKEFNPFLKNAWLLMGKAQFQQGDFLGAASTFAYITRFYAAEPLVVAEARLWLVRAQLQLGWMYDAEDALRKLQGIELPKRLLRERDITMAAFLIAQKQYAEAVPYLGKAARQASHNFDQARWYYLLAQLNMLLERKADAYTALNHCLAQNPPYQMALQARILQTEALSNRQNATSMLRRLQRMTKDPNNASYLDQLYFAQGNIYLAQRDTAAAISTYETGRYRAAQATPAKGLLMFTLANLYWQQQRFDKAQPCYNEAISLLDKSHAGYEQLLQRSAVLDRLVPHTSTIFQQDSLLSVAALPEAQRNALIDGKIAEYKRLLAEQRKNKADSALRAAREANGEDLPQRPTLPTARPNATSSGGWYFYNAQAVMQGKQAFARQWGRRKNEDDWRRANHTVVSDGQNMGFDYAADDSINNLLKQRRDSLSATGMAQRDIDAQLRDYAQQLSEGTPAPSAENGKTTETAAEKDPTQRAFYLAQLPLSAEAKQKAREEINEALIAAGLIEKDDLEDFGLARHTLQRFLRQAPNHERAAEANYHLLLMAQRQGQKSEAERLRNLMVQSYPQSPLTRLVSDPDFEINLHHGREREDSLYAATYAAYLAGHHSEVTSNYERSTRQFPTGANRPKFMLLHSLARLSQAPRDTLVSELKQLATEHPKSDVAELAGMIARGLQEGRTIGQTFRPSDLWARRLEEAQAQAVDATSDSKLTADRDVPFVFVVAYPSDSLSDNRVLYALAQFNIEHFVSRNFDISQQRSNGITQFRVQGFRSFADVHYYAQQLFAQPQLRGLFRLVRTELISASNLRLLGTVVSFDDYRAFYDREFAPLKIKADLPTEFEPDAPKQIYEDELPQGATPNKPQQRQTPADDEYEYEE